MTFQPTTIEALRDTLTSLEKQREQHKADLDYHASHLTKCQAKYDGLSAAIDDYVSLLEYAEITDGFGKLAHQSVEGEADR
jgi:hypothetical protein